MAIRVIDFEVLEKKLRCRAGWKEFFAPAAGGVTVLAISRDGCPGCVKFKPVFKRLAAGSAISISFFSIHISCPGGSMAGSLRAKKLLGHYFYPSVVVLVRSRDLGVFEYYRSISPSAAELKRKLSAALRAAKMLAGK